MLLHHIIGPDPRGPHHGSRGFPLDQDGGSVASAIIKNSPLLHSEISVAAIEIFRCDNRFFPLLQLKIPLPNSKNSVATFCNLTWHFCSRKNSKFEEQTLQIKLINFAMPEDEIRRFWKEFCNRKNPNLMNKVCKLN